jgi:hypothetical protein
MSWPQSIPFLISKAVEGLLRETFDTDPPDLRLKIERNPRNPYTRKDGDRIIWVTTESDSWVDEKAAIGKRRYAFTLGFICRLKLADEIADQDYIQAMTTIRDRGTRVIAEAVTAAGGQIGGAVVERNTVYSVEGIEIDGALILAGWHIEYSRPKPAR